MKTSHRMPALFACAILACSSSAAPDDENAVFPADPLTTVSSDTGALEVSVRTAPTQPPQRGTSSVELRVNDATGAPEDGLSVDVVPLMPAHGHGTSVKPDVTAKGGGIYLVRNVDLFMPGNWELRLTFSGKVTDHAAPQITVP